MCAVQSVRLVNTMGMQHTASTLFNHLQSTIKILNLGVTPSTSYTSLPQLYIQISTETCTYEWQWFLIQLFSALTLKRY
jgi:hypothetical protein